MEMARALQKASDEARRGALAEARTPELMSEVLQSINGQRLRVFTAVDWFGHFVNQKKKSRAAATAACADDARVHGVSRTSCQA